MNPEQMRSLIRLYRGYLEPFGYPVCKADTRTPHYPTRSEAISHALWMLDEMSHFSPDQEDKTNRWLGFVQGLCWDLGIFTVHEMRHHVAAAKET